MTPSRWIGRLLFTIAALAASALLPAPASAADPPLARCDPIDPAHCLFPWPNNYFTVADSTTNTGRRVNLDLTAMPKNTAGKPIDPADYNMADGFSPGQKIVTKVPGLDTPEAFQNTGAVPITDVERSFDPDQPIVVMRAGTRQRHLIWSELDANPADPADVALIIRPAVNFVEGGRYIVALRNLKNAQDETIQPSEGFRVYRDRISTSDPDVEARRPQMERIFSALERAGIERQDLFLAWDFTVASRRSLTDRMLFIRNDAFAQLGDTNLRDRRVQGSAPSFVVTQTQDFPPCGSDDCQEGEDDRIARRVDGTFVVPCYLDQPGCPPGSRFAFTGSPPYPNPSRIPGNTYAANFICNIPRSAVDGDAVQPARPSLYGHGLLGSADEVNAGNVKSMGNEHNFVFCATDWIGMAEQDLPNVGTILADLSRFPTLVDRVQQGMLNFTYLGRLMIHPQGFNSNPAFQFVKGAVSKPVIDTTRLFYDGNSQGGIIGGALTAVAPDFERAVLGVPGMNYSTLLRRSVDFDPFATVIYQNYTNELERPLWISMIQMLWDRGEANGYAHHMTGNPLPHTPAHRVLLHEAFGDHQVANVTTEVEARTIGAQIRQPALDPGRHSDVQPFFGIPAIPSFPFDGSALVVWDSGSPTPPTTNTPPRAGEDPHGHPRSEPSARLQKSEFLKVGGRVIDVCGASPCYARGYTGTGP
jgi:hypothetical protein